MKLIVVKPTSPSKRHYLNIYNKLNKIPTLKTKLIKNINSSGRNNKGKITIRHKGNINKRLYRIINFNKQNNLTGITFSIEYDPFRTANIAAIYNLETKSFTYIIAPKNLKPGHIIKAGKNGEIKIGNTIKLSKVITGCPIFNISIKFNSIGKIARSAGTYCLLLSKTKKNCEIMLSSGTKVLLANNSVCTVGITSNELLFLKQLGKAGRSRWLNVRPTVRGVSMNSVDHPNGGGEGKKSSKNKNPWGN